MIPPHIRKSWRLFDLALAFKRRGKLAAYRRALDVRMSIIEREIVVPHPLPQPARPKSAFLAFLAA